MKAVGIRELKNNLSRYIAEVRAGELVLVTDRGTVVAEIRPPGTIVPSDEAPGIQALIDEGRIRRARRPDAGALPNPIPGGPHCEAGTSARLLDKDRREGAGPVHGE